MSVRILLFSQYFPPEMGALAVRSYEHSLWWVQMGHKVTVICGTPNYPDGKVYEGFRNRLFQRRDVDGIEVIRTWVLPQPNRNTWERISNYLSYFITSVLAGFRVRKPDIVIGSSPQLLTGLAAYLIAKIRRIPFVLEIRDLWPESIAASGPTDNSLLLRALTGIANFLYRRADKVVVVTEPFKKRLSQIPGVNKKRIIVVPNAINLRILNPGNRACKSIRARYALEGKFVVSYVGTIGAAHGIGIVLDAAAKLRENREIVFLLVGDGAERKKLEKESNRRKLVNVIFAGRQPKEDIPAFLRASDVSLVLLRRREVFKTVIPSKMLESMAMSKPIILGVEGEARRILEEAGTGIPITPENVGELVNAIERLHDNDKLRDSLGRNGREYITRYYNRDKLATDYATALEKTVNS